MASATLSLGSAGYDLLEAISSSPSSGSQLNVKRSGNAHQIKSTQQDNTIDGLGLTTGLLGQSPAGWVRKAGSTATTEQTTLNSSNVNIFANVSDFQAALGSNADTLNIFGNVSGSTIELDNSSDTPGDFNDILNIQGSLLSTDNSLTSVDNEIYAGGGNDTIRIAGSAQNANIFLGFGNDSLVISGAATNVDVKGDEEDDLNGNDYIEFRDAATDVRVQSGGGFDTVIFSKGLDSSNSNLASDSIYYSGGYSTPLSGLAAVELGSGDDSLVLKGNYSDATFNTGSGTDTVSIGGGDFTNVKFQLDGNWDTDSYGGNEENFDGGDKLTTAANSWFTSTEFSSNNSLGDTLVFGSSNIFTDTNFYLGQGNDSIVFGSGSIFNNYSATDSTISTGYGADTIVFGSSSSFYGNLTLDLGNDEFSDVVRFGVNNEFSPNTSEFRIIGADESDMLFVGAVAYTYNTNDGWMQAGYDSLSFKNLG